MPWFRARGTLAAVVCVLSVGCEQAVLSLGNTPDEARGRADELLGALAARFGPLEREPAFLERRPRLARAALAPSRAFADRSLWTAAEGDWRRLEFSGTSRGGRYRIGVGARAPTPARPGEYRADVRLRALGPGEFEWQGHDELAVGTVTIADVDRALTALLAAAEQISGADAAARRRAELPRTAAALGRLVVLDALETAPGPEGTALTVVLTLRPEGLQKEFPRYAAYVRKYIVRIRLHATAEDDAGGRWWEADARDGRMTLRLRVRDGRLAPLVGPPRSRPDHLRVRSDFSTRMGIVRVGVRGLEAELGLVRAAHTAALEARFRRAPDWELPFLVAPLVRGSLRRPFESEGAFTALAVRDGAGQTLLIRDYRLAVKESWIVRWLAGLAGSAMNEFWPGAEEEADRFAGQALLALRQDAVALIARGARPATAGGPLTAPGAAPGAPRAGGSRR